VFIYKRGVCADEEAREGAADQANVGSRGRGLARGQPVNGVRSSSRATIPPADCRDWIAFGANFLIDKATMLA